MTQDRPIDAGSTTPVLLEQGRRALQAGDKPSAERWIGEVLAREPRNVVGLILRGDLLHAQGDRRAASSHFQAALRLAEQQPGAGASLAAELQHAQAMCESYHHQFEDYLRAEVAALGTATPRFEQSLDLLTGRKQLFLQQPKVYYFPGLPQIQFYERECFPWLENLERAAGGIRQELLRALDEGVDMEPYVQDMPGRPRTSEAGLRNNPAWSALHLYKQGQPVAENVARFPQTMAALAELPLSRLPGRSPSAMFSVLQPGTRIPPHCGLINTRLICHLPLIVPSDCGLRVGNDVRPVEADRAWVFDDTIEHEAWNLSDRPRIILLFEIWRPELSARERDMVSRMFEAIDTYHGPPAEWSI